MVSFFSGVKEFVASTVCFKLEVPLGLVLTHYHRLNLLVVQTLHASHCMQLLLGSLVYQCCITS